MQCVLPYLVSPSAPTTTASYTLSLHDALPIWMQEILQVSPQRLCQSAAYSGIRIRRKIQISTGFHLRTAAEPRAGSPMLRGSPRSEEHTSELQSRFDLVCRLLLEKKKNNKTTS